LNKPTPKERLEHILKAITLTELFVENKSAQDFALGMELPSAVLYQFLIIGEAIRHVDNSILEQYNYPWLYPNLSEILLPMNTIK
jgi:uncharacterized protein with HEPN domain